jgi:hypothetical protein
MISLGKKIATGAVATVAALAMMTPGAFAVSKYKLSPPSTNVTGSLKSGTHLTAAGTIDGFAITVTCTSVGVAGKTPADGMVIKASSKPTITGCTDSLGGTDTVTTAGTWKVKWFSPTKAAVIVPKDGGTFTSTLVSGCTVTLAPSGAAKLAGSYTNDNTLTVSGAALPVTGSGCTASSPAHLSFVLQVSPNVYVVPNT